MKSHCLILPTILFCRSQHLDPEQACNQRWMAAFVGDLTLIRARYVNRRAAFTPMLALVHAETLDLGRYLDPKVST